jgi:hypothetical protein
MEADQNNLAALSAQGVDQRAAVSPAIATILCALLQLGTVKFVAFGTAILTNLGVRRAA